MGHKAEETNHNISYAFDQGTAKKYTAWWWFKTFGKGDESLEDEECSGQPLEVDNDQLEIINEGGPLTTTEKLLKNSTSTVLWSFSIWNKLERWKISISRCCMSWPQIKNIVILQCHPPLFYATATDHFWTGLLCATKSRFYMTTNVHQLSDWTKKKHQSTSQSQAYAKSSHRHCLMVCCWPDPLQLSESQRDHYIWEVYSANGWASPKTARSAASIGQQKGPSSSPWQFPTARHKSMFQKLNKLGYKACFICHIYLTSCQLTTTSSSISTPFCRENTFTFSTQKILSKSSLNSEAWIFLLQE